MDMSVNRLPGMGQNFVRALMSQDGEPDDFHAIMLAKSVLANKDVTVDCAIGNKKIQLASSDEEEEMKARLEFTKQIFPSASVIPGARRKEEESKEYVDLLCNTNYLRPTLALHTASFKSLSSLFSKVMAKELSQLTILAYGAVNVKWANLSDSENGYESFYNGLRDHDAKLIQVDGFPFLGTRNKVTHKNTPLTYSLLDHIDTAIGSTWLNLASTAAANVRAGQVEKIVGYIEDAIDRSQGELKSQLAQKVIDIAALLGKNISYPLPDQQVLREILNQSLAGDQHDRLAKEINALKLSIYQALEIPEANQPAYNGAFNIYIGTSLKGQILLADQLPAILMCEMIENRKGIGAFCREAKFQKIENGFPQFAIAQTKSNLYYLKTRWVAEELVRAHSMDVNEVEQTLISAALKYIDLCLAVNFLTEDGMISSEKKAELLQDPIFKEKLRNLFDEVKNMGYEPPLACNKLEILQALQV